MEKGMSDCSKGEMASLVVEATSGGESSEFYQPTMSATSATNSTPSSSCCAYLSARIDRLRESRSEYDSAVEFEIAASTSHWTQLDSDDDTEYSHEDDLKHFELLKLDYRWGYYDQAYYEEKKLVVGKKIAEGGQAEIYEAKLDGIAIPYVVKVFKEGYSLRSLQRQWPPGMVALWRCDTTIDSLHLATLVSIEGAVLLKDERFKNRFAFVMQQTWGDLRKHIDLRMLNRKDNRGPPYSSKEATDLMYAIAWDMSWLHKHGILHRDLKASNVLVWVDSTLPKTEQYSGKVADFECSVGMVGTGFWRAPEILQQLKDGVSMSNVIFSTKADVYSFGMTCYEIVTGCTPFEDLSWQNYDHVLSGNQPVLPLDLDLFIRDMIISCWQLDPLKRHSFSYLCEKLRMVTEL